MSKRKKKKERTIKINDKYKIEDLPSDTESDENTDSEQESDSDSEQESDSHYSDEESDEKYVIVMMRKNLKIIHQMKF